jgi:hypothetical protein
MIAFLERHPKFVDSIDTAMDLTLAAITALAINSIWPATTVLSLLTISLSVGFYISMSFLVSGLFWDWIDKKKGNKSE